ncbi:aminotransferase class I/II-fold pyridoxal phosphate-dependent enzyme [Pyrobaculum sp.]|uniref:pyridoxal phosphate-dependent aminotransferase n=1 Tax=Pyrobaculum sp. TaxID=2004705 RepID=UPI00316970ED
METFKWIREKIADYDLANSGVAKLNAFARGDAPPLEDVLSDLYGVSKQELVLTAGAQEGVFLAFLAIKPSYVVTVVPEYEPITKLPQTLGVRQVQVGNVWDAPLEPGGLILFSNPNNPTGRFLDKRELAELADEAWRRGAYLVVDIIFSDFVTDDVKELPLEGVVYAHSTDKFFTSDIRVGWAFGDRRIVEKIRYLKDLANPGPREFEKRAAAWLVSRRGEVKRRNLSIIRPNAEALLAAFPNAVYRPDMPIALVPTKCHDVELAERLLAKGVKTVPGRFFQAPYSIRVGLGVEEPERFREALRILVESWC